MSIFFKLFTLLIALVLSGAATARELPSESILESIASLRTEQTNLSRQQSLMLCLLLASGEAAKNKCMEQLKDSAATDIQDAATVPLTSASDGEDHQVGTDVKGFQNKVGQCLELMDGYTSGDRDKTAIDSFSSTCSQQEMRDQLQKTGDSLRKAFDSCKKSSADLTTFYDQNSGLPILDLIDAARKAEDKFNDAKDCIDNVGKAADSARDSMKKFESALASTMAFCTAVPEPYSCGIFAALQLLMALFESGGGGGSGDGSGPNDADTGGQSAGGGQPDQPSSPYQQPNEGQNPQLNTTVDVGDNCVLVRDGKDLTCGSLLTAPGYFEGATFKSSSDLTTDQLTKMNAYLSDETFNNIDHYFQGRKMLLMGGNSVKFCVDIMPGLDAAFDDTRKAQQGDEMPVTGVILTPIGGSPEYDVRLDHSGRGCK